MSEFVFNELATHSSAETAPCREHHSENVRPTWNPEIKVWTYLFAAACDMCAISYAIQIIINQCQLPTMSPSRVWSTVRLRVCLVFTRHICLVQLNCVAVGVDVVHKDFTSLKYYVWWNSAPNLALNLRLNFASDSRTTQHVVKQIKLQQFKKKINNNMDTNDISTIPNPTTQ